MYKYTYFILSLFNLLFIIDALPIQSVFNQKEIKSLEYSYQFQEEYNIYQSVIEHYESIVDQTLSSESEYLLYDLIHLPKQTLREILYLQSQLIGADSLTESQLSKMPSIIGKHIGGMNKNLYLQVEKAVAVSWNAWWKSDILQDNDKLLSFLSSVNTFVATSLIKEMNRYDLLEQIRHDIEQVDEYSESSIFTWIKENMLGFFTRSFTTQDIEIDFLRQHLCNTRTNLLVELDVQFINFFEAIKQDLI